MSDRHPSLLQTIRSILDATPPAISSPGTLRLHTLFTIPRQVKSLYPLAHIHPTDLEYNKRSHPIGALEEQIFVTASFVTEEKDAAPLLILAMELYLYTIPESGAAVLYISKLDSSGYGPKGIPSSLRKFLSKQVLGEGKAFGNTLTATLSSAVTQHFTTFRHWENSSVRINHLSVHILARSQRAYLFPSSPENPDKKVLSDGGLIKWWRAVMSDAIVLTRSSTSSSDPIDARAYYVIPGYTKLESHPLVPLVREDGAKVLREAIWTYGHPYSSNGASCAESDLPPLPLHWQNSAFVRGAKDGEAVEEGNGKAEYDPRKVRTVPTLMPHFSDDPKTRFLDEMARDAHEHSGWKKKAPSSGESRENGNATEANHEGAENGKKGKENGTATEAEQIAAAEENGKKRAAEDSQGSAPPEKRPKTDTSDSPATTSSGPSSSGVPLVTLRALMRERSAMDDLPIDEFWERMAFRQECCSGNAVGVLVILFTRLPSSPSSPPQSQGLERQPLSLPYKVLSDLVFKSLMKDTCEWNKLPLARTLTEAWWQGVDREVRRKGGAAQYVEEGKEKEGLIGEGLIWADFALEGPTGEQMEQAKKQQEGEKEGDKVGNGGAPVQMLSVKRKKKPAP